MNGLLNTYVLANAKAQADKNPGFYVFADDGTSIYLTGTSAEPYRTYTVVKGDSLWAIAQRLLGSGARYPEIVKLNGLPSTIIYSGKILKSKTKYRYKNESLQGFLNWNFCRLFFVQSADFCPGTVRGY